MELDDLQLWERNKEAVHAYRDGYMSYKKALAFIREGNPQQHPTKMALALLNAERRDRIRFRVTWIAVSLAIALIAGGAIFLLHHFALR